MTCKRLSSARPPLPLQRDISVRHLRPLDCMWAPGVSARCSRFRRNDHSGDCLLGQAWRIAAPLGTTEAAAVAFVVAAIPQTQYGNGKSLAAKPHLCEHC